MPPQNRTRRGVWYNHAMISPIDDTICALATPAGTGGIGVIRVSGPSAFAIADAITRQRHGRKCRDYQGFTLHRAEVAAPNGEIIDDVLVSIFHGPHSYTGEDVVEISGHGGSIPLRRILERLLASGARLAAPGEFTQRAFLNGKMDLAQAESVADSIAAQTEEAHQLALRQGEGQLSRAVHRVRDQVLGVIAQIEASIDFPDEVGELDRIPCRQELLNAKQRIEALLSTADRGILYRQGLKLVLAGRPNVGKSSLLNALLRVSRAIVTPIPGTTRDVVEESFNLRGIPVRAMDTAGLRDSDDIVEQLGVEKSRQSIASADLVLVILDAAAGEAREDRALRESVAGRSHLVVWNKWDLVAGRSLPEDGIAISAHTGWNIDALEAAIAELAHGGDISPSQASEAVVTHTRHRQALESAQIAISRAISTLETSMPSDFVSVDLQDTLIVLGAITGETAPEDVIREIFSRFCIGK